MARTDLTITDISDPNSSGGAWGGSTQAVTMDEASTGDDGNQFTLTGNEIVLFHNTDTSGHNITVTSVDDKYGRSEDISSESIAAGAIKAFGPVRLQGWLQTDGNLYLSADNTSVEIGVLRIYRP